MGQLRVISCRSTIIYPWIYLFGPEQQHCGICKPVRLVPGYKHAALWSERAAKIKKNMMCYSWSCLVAGCLIGSLVKINFGWCSMPTTETWCSPTAESECQWVSTNRKSAVPLERHAVVPQEAKEARTSTVSNTKNERKFLLVYPFVLENCADEDMAASDAVISAYGVRNQALISLGSWSFWRDELQKAWKLRWESDIQATQQQGIW